MANIQQLEKLYHVQKLFQSSDSLESVVATERIQQLIERTEHLIQQRAFLREERRKVRLASELISSRKSAMSNMQRQDWNTLQDVSKHGRKIQMNVGGLLFEAPESVLRRDPNSLLCQICETDHSKNPILPDSESGFFTFERDWWLFRYIMKFMRDGTLPDDRQLLAQLYKECSFWNLREMQKAIEEQKLNLLAPVAKDNEKPAAALATAIWWRKLPSWWSAIDEAKSKAKSPLKIPPKKEDWWKDTTYKGKVFLPLSTDPIKVVTKAGEKDVKPTASVTWEAKEKNRFL